MARRRKHRLPPLKAVVALVLIAFALITANEFLQIPEIPTWSQLLTQSGLKGNDPLPDSQLRLTVLDVGNADCILLENSGEYMLIDAGENDDGEDIVTYLKQRDITRLKYVIATHADSDHIGGMDEVVKAISIDTFIMSFMPEGYTPTTRTYENLLNALVEKELMPTEPKHGDIFTFGDARIEILSGLSDHTSTNEQSVVCRVEFGNHRFLMMGDAGEDVEEELLNAKVDVQADFLKVGHHGSRNSSTKAFIKAVSPSYAVITCGLNNSYNHPHEETLDVLKKNGIQVYRSDLQGVITVVSDGSAITVTTEK